MAHMVETMAYAGATPWHGLGVRVSEPAKRDYRRMLVEAGLDWQVQLAPLQTIDTQAPVRHRAVRRTIDGRILGVVGPVYQPLQNERALAWFEPFLMAGQAELHTAGSLRGGERVWALAKIAGDPLRIVADDVVERFILLSHGHDGVLAIRVGFTPIRVVCNNTLSMAHADGRSHLIRIVHSGATEANLQTVREVMDAASSTFAATADQYRLLASKGIKQADVLRYVKVVFGLAEKQDAELSVKARRMVESITANVEAGRGQTLPGVRGTWWAAYNGVNEYLGYQRGRTNETRLDSLWFGEGANLNARALSTAVEMAAAA